MAGRILLPIESADRCTAGEAVAVVSCGEPLKSVGLGAPDRKNRVNETSPAYVGIIP